MSVPHPMTQINDLLVMTSRLLWKPRGVTSFPAVQFEVLAPDFIFHSSIFCPCPVYSPHYINAVVTWRGQNLSRYSMVPTRPVVIPKCYGSLMERTPSVSTSYKWHSRVFIPCTDCSVLTGLRCSGASSIFFSKDNYWIKNQMKCNFVYLYKLLPLINSPITRGTFWHIVCLVQCE